MNGNEPETEVSSGDDNNGVIGNGIEEDELPAFSSDNTSDTSNDKDQILTTTTPPPSPSEDAPEFNAAEDNAEVAKEDTKENIHQKDESSAQEVTQQTTEDVNANVDLTEVKNDIANVEETSDKAEKLHGGLTSSVAVVEQALAESQEILHERESIAEESSAKTEVTDIVETINGLVTEAMVDRAVSVTQTAANNLEEAVVAEVTSTTEDVASVSEEAVKGLVSEAVVEKALSVASATLEEATMLEQASETRIKADTAIVDEQVETSSDGIQTTEDIVEENIIASSSEVIKAAEVLAEEAIVTSVDHVEKQSSEAIKTSEVFVEEQVENATTELVNTVVDTAGEQIEKSAEVIKTVEASVEEKVEQSSESVKAAADMAGNQIEISLETAQVFAEEQVANTSGGIKAAGEDPVEEQIELFTETIKATEVSLEEQVESFSNDHKNAEVLVEQQMEQTIKSAEVVVEDRVESKEVKEAVEVLAENGISKSSEVMETAQEVAMEAANNLGMIFKKQLSSKETDDVQITGFEKPYEPEKEDKLVVAIEAVEEQSPSMVYHMVQSTGNDGPDQQKLVIGLVGDDNATDVEDRSTKITSTGDSTTIITVTTSSASTTNTKVMESAVSNPVEGSTGAIISDMKTAEAVLTTSEVIIVSSSQSEAKFISCVDIHPQVAAEIKPSLPKAEAPKPPARTNGTKAKALAKDDEAKASSTDELNSSDGPATTSTAPTTIAVNGDQEQHSGIIGYIRSFFTCVSSK